MYRKVYTDFPRVASLLTRASRQGVDGHAIIEKIASFPNVESFQVWKNSQTEEMQAVIGRVGRGYYRHLRDIVREA
jgi:hypothetical protein